MELLLLGPFEAIGPSGPVALRGQKERVLLALLAARANEVVSTTALIDGLWGERPPPSALKTVHAHVARVRRSLEAAGLGDVLATRDPGYVLAVDPDRIDEVRFERHAAAGCRHLQAGRPDLAEKELAAGLALWRGDALADCRAADALDAEATRLEEMRAKVIEDRVDAELALGRHATVVAELESLLVRYPLRERLWGALILALHRSQRQGDALRAYQRARTTLTETLGVEPGENLRRLEAAVLEGDASLDLAPPAPGVTTASSSGDRLVTAASGGPALVGREYELGVLGELWSRTAAGAGPVALIAGEPGIGKTRLAAEVALAAHADGATVLYGRCDEGLGVPYQPFVEALRAWVAACPDDRLPALLGSFPGELVRLVPDLRERCPDLPAPLQSDPATQQYRLFDAVVSWLGAAADTAPLVLVLDDLHWAAHPTVLLLGHILRSDRVRRMLILATYRQSELGTDHPFSAFLADVHTSSGTHPVERIELQGLDPDAVAEFVETAGGRGLDDVGRSFVRTLHAETAGNPFFVNELVRSLVEAGALGESVDPEDADRRLRDVQIPPAARDVVIRRVSRLTETARQALSGAAVVGLEFDARVLESMFGLDEDVLIGALEEATAARLVEEAGPDRFYFAHALVRAALYDGLSESRRVRLHRRAGEAIERVHAARLADHFAALAYHYAGSEPEKAVRYSVDAADAAIDGLAFDDAADLCRRALAIIERARSEGNPLGLEDEFDVLLRLGRAEFRAGHPRARSTLLLTYDLARQLGDANRLAEAVLTANRGFFARMGRTDHALVAALEDAIAQQPEGDTSVRAELLGVLASELEWSEDGDRRFALSDQALTIARSAGDNATLARVLLLRTMTIAAPDTLGERVANCRELLDVATALGDPAISFQAAWARSPTAVESGDVDAVDEMVDLASALAEDLRQPQLLWQASFMRAARLILRGRLDEAEALAEETRLLGRRASQDIEAEIFYNEQILEIRRWQQRLPEVIGPFADFAGNDSIDFGYALTRYLYDAGEHEAAAERYRTIVARVELPLRRDLLAAPLLCNLAYLAARLGDVEHAGTLYEALSPLAGGFANTTVAKPIGAHFLGMLATTLGDADAADRHFEMAEAAHVRASTPLLEAESLLEHARLLAASADGAQVQRLVAEAREIGAAHGATLIVAGCDELESLAGG